MHGRVSMIDAGVHLRKEGRGAVMSACMLVGWFRMIDAGGYIDGRRGGQLLVSTPREVRTRRNKHLHARQVINGNQRTSIGSCSVSTRVTMAS